MKSFHTIVALAPLFCSFVSNSCEGSPCDLTQVPYCTWPGSNSSFILPNDSVSLINFETLPNGQPSFGGAAITPAFNYVLQGAVFSSPIPSLFISGNGTTGYDLVAYNSNIVAHTWITAQLTQPAHGIGFYTTGHTTLFAYDAEGALITSVFHDSGFTYFMGIRSNLPITRVVVDDGTNGISIDNFTIIHFPVPEPATAALLLLAAPVVVRRPASRRL